MASKKEEHKRRFGITDRSSVPTGRKGKHHAIVASILNDLEGLDRVWP
ncbi:MAG TPA: hypothetical protein VKT29_15195 [Terriglobales bacterium]|nr:hypothetical protein [Terriglobales bacterium]